ncbi:MAG: type II secretion system F family protein [bacterium]
MNPFWGIWGGTILASTGLGFLGFTVTWSLLERETRWRRFGFFEGFSTRQKKMIVLSLAVLLLMGTEISAGILAAMACAVLAGLLAGRKRLPKLRFKIQEGQKLEKMRELFPSAVGMAVQALKAGQTMPQVMEYLAQEGAEPFREEWKKVRAEMEWGASAEDALIHLGDRYPQFSDFHQFLRAYQISRHTGADLTRLLEVLLEGIETRSRLSRKMDAMTAQAKLSGWLMGLLPFLLLIVFFFMDPSLLKPLVTQKAGWGILALSALMETMGFLWIRQLLRVEL